MFSSGDPHHCNENKTIDQQGFRQMRGLLYYLNASVVKVFSQ